MLKILSPLEMIQRVDVTAKTTGSVFTSGTTGSWVQLETDGSGNPVCNLSSSNAKPAWAVWTEGIRSVSTSSALTTSLGQLQPMSAGGAGFSPDALRTGKVTTLVGKWRGLTDRVDLANYAIGDLLTVATTEGSYGRLTKITTWSGQAYIPYPVAIVRGGPYTSYEYLGQTYTGVYEIECLV